MMNIREFEDSVKVTADNLELSYDSVRYLSRELNKYKDILTVSEYKEMFNSVQGHFFIKQVKELSDLLTEVKENFLLDI